MECSVVLRKMFLRVLLPLVLLCAAQAQFINFDRFGAPPFQRDPNRGPAGQREPSSYKLCTTSHVEFDKCVRTREVATGNSLNLQLECVERDSVEDCLTAVRHRDADMIVLDELDYKSARSQGLEPVVFERDSNASVYIAVAPRDITFVELCVTPAAVNRSDYRAVNAAALFNMRREQAICSITNETVSTATVRIVNSDEYTPSPDEVLICSGFSYAEFSEYESCNVDVSLQRAVFVSRRTPPRSIRSIKRIYDSILQEFGPGATSSDAFNFFSTFEGSDDVIFRNNTIAFDLRPSPRNGVTEKLFNYFQRCNSEDEE